MFRKINVEHVENQRNTKELDLNQEKNSVMNYTKNCKANTHIKSEKIVRQKFK